MNTGGEHIFSNGSLYVPTPLDYISGIETNQYINKLCDRIQSYTPNDLASFFFHPFLEFNFIKLNADGSVNYHDPTSYLHKLVTCFKSQNFSFVSITSLYNFIPSKRQTHLLRNDCTLFMGDVNGDGISELIFWNSAQGKWEVGKNTLVNPPLRAQPDYAISNYLENWAVGNVWQPFIGDFDGNNKEDVAVYNANAGQWQIALSNGDQFIPDPGFAGNNVWLDNWGVGNKWQPLIGDFNGDKKDDVVLYNDINGGWQVALSMGNRFMPDAGKMGNFHWLENWGLGANWKPFIGDFNGDGSDDVVLYNNIEGNWQVALSKGNMLIPDAGILKNYHWLKNWGVGSQWKVLVGDFNGDKKSDILVTDLANGDWQICLSKGNEFQPYGTPFMGWGKYPNAVPYSGHYTVNGKSSLLLWNKNLFDGTIDFALSNVGNKNDSIQTNQEVIPKNTIGGFVTIYPNPSKDYLNIIFNGEGLKRIGVYNVLGQMILTSETADNSIHLNLTEKEPGIYFIHIHEGAKTNVQKFILERSQ